MRKDKDLRLEHVKIDKTANFHRTIFGGQVHVMHSYFGEYVYFDGANFLDNAFFSWCTFRYDTFFSNAVDAVNEPIPCVFNARAIFQRLSFHRKISFDNAEFHEGFEIIEPQFYGMLSLENTKIENDKDPRRAYRDQEIAYRWAKNTTENVGLNGDDYYFEEMIAIRKQQENPIKRFLEWILIEKALGYGVRPWHIIGSWIYVVLIFTTFFFIPHVYAENIFSIGQINFIFTHWISLVTNDWGPYLINCLTLSTMKATIPAISPFQINDNYILLTYVEALIGTYLWAGVIASIGKKLLKN